MREIVTVLVVDDDRRMVKTICDILTVKGYAAETAFSGEEALEKVGSGQADCVLMDIRMPGMSGVDATRAIVELAPQLPVVLMSAYVNDEQLYEARRNGAYAVLTKPLDLQLILTFLSLLRNEECVLIVDDDPVFCRTLKDVMQARGYWVETEIDPGKVLGYMEQNCKLAVVLDLKLGSADGLEVLQEIRTKFPSKPVILVTGYDGEMGASIEKGLKIGAYTCLYKPFEAEELIGIIEEVHRKRLMALLN